MHLCCFKKNLIGKQGLSIKNVGKYKLGLKMQIVASCRGTRCRRGRKSHVQHQFPLC